MDLAARLDVVETENDMLRERIAQLEALLGVQFRSPVEWRLTSAEEGLLGHMLARDSITKESAIEVLYGGRVDVDVPEPKIIDVFICKLRRKIKPWGIEIQTLWGRGYALDHANKARVRQFAELAA